jgi:hypothetical protein
MSESGLNELNMSISGLEDRQKDLLRKRRNVLD